MKNNANKLLKMEKNSFIIFIIILVISIYIYFSIFKHNLEIEIKNHEKLEGLFK